MASDHDPGGPPPHIQLAVRVYLEDTDAGGVVYHASYLRFMERARTELLRSAGLQQSLTFGDDVSLVVYAMQLRFLRPAQLDDELRVTCRVTQAGGARVGFSQQVLLPDGELCCTAEVEVACIALGSKRPRRLPFALRDALTRLVNGGQSSPASPGGS